MEIQVKKGEILQTAGSRNTKIFRVVSGLLRTYTVDSKGKEHIFLFAPEGWMAVDTHPKDQPAALNIEALEDSLIIIEEKEDGIISVPDVSPLLRRITVLQERIIMLMSYTAIERYEHFLSVYPNIVQRVPQRMIASYLGITPEALSRAKKRYHNSKKL